MVSFRAVLLRLAVVLVPLSLLSACVSTEDMPPRPSPEQLAEQAGFKIVEPVKRLPNYRIDGFRGISNYAIIMDSGVKGRYLVTVMQDCIGLRNAQAIGTTSTVGDLTTFDSILVRNGPGGGTRCPITNIYKLEPLPADAEASGE